MAWTVVETPNAKYVLMFSYHDMTLAVPPHKFDCLVFEGQGVETAAKGIAGKRIELSNTNIQYEKLYEEAIRKGKQIWITDADVTEKSLSKYQKGEQIVRYGSIASWLAGLGIVAKQLHNTKTKKPTRRKFLKTLTGIGLMSLGLPRILNSPILGLRSHNTEIKMGFLWDLNTRYYTELTYGKGVVEIRNAITAEKTETFLAPKLRQELGRKPVIAMAWGVGHYGVKRLLENPLLRKRILEKNNLEKYVKGDYSQSFKIHLDQNGRLVRVEEFTETMRRQKKKKAKPRRSLKEPISRRALGSKLTRPFSRAAKAMRKV